MEDDKLNENINPGEETPEVMSPPSENPATPIETEPEPVGETNDNPYQVAEPTPTSTNPFITGGTPRPSEPVTTSMPFPEGGIPLSTEGEKKPKKFLGLIIAIVLLLVLGGGGAAAYFVMHTPENLATSAFGKLLDLKNTEINGTIEAGLEDSVLLTTDFTGKVDKNGRSAATSSVSAKYGAISINFGAEAIVDSDYTMFMKTDGLKDLATTAGSFLGTMSYDSSSNGLVSTLSTLAEKVDKNWWKISVPETIDSLEDASDAEKAEYKKKYDCAVNALNEAKNNTGKYLDYYKKSPFIALADYTGEKTFETSGKAYTLKYDAEKFVNFSKDIYNDVSDNPIIKCFESDGETVENEEFNLTTEQAKATFEALPEVIVTIKNTLLGGELSGLYVESTAKTETTSYGYTTGSNYKMSVKFSPLSGEIATPSDSKNITELVKEVEEAFETYQSSYYSSLYSSYTTNCDMNSSDLSDCLWAENDEDDYDTDADFQRNGDYTDLLSTIRMYITNNNGKLPPAGILDAAVYMDDGVDPDGKPYRLRLFPISEASSYGPPAADENGTDVYIVTKATCSDDTGVAASGSDNEREFVIYGGLKSGSSCIGNN